MLCVMIYNYIVPKISVVLDQWIDGFRNLYQQNNLSLEQKNIELEQINHAHNSLTSLQDEERIIAQKEIDKREADLIRRYELLRQQQISREKNMLLDARKEKFSRIIFDFMKKTVTTQ